MSASSIYRAANDPDLIQRVTAIAHELAQNVDDLGMTVFGQQLLNGSNSVAPLMYPVAVDYEAAYETAVNSGRGAPGHDVDVITDANISAAITVGWPKTEADRIGGTITTITPNRVVVGDPDFVLVVHGRNFGTEALVAFGGIGQPTTRVSSTELQANVVMANYPVPVQISVSLLGMTTQTIPLIVA